MGSMGSCKALERLQNPYFRLDIMACLDPTFNPGSKPCKGWVLQIAKVPLQISFKYSEPFLAFLVNF